MNYHRTRFRAPRPPPAPFPRCHPQGVWPRPPPLLSDSLLLPSDQQPPPMFGPRGTTIPPRFFNMKPHTQVNNQSSDDEYWCETCDRGFRTSVLLENHKKQHERCNIDGCSFVAHPKIITKHIQMQHSTGLYNKIAKLNDPEEIQKWREERRKKFPTKANIDKKNAAINEKILRGEKMGLQKKTFPDKSGNQKNKFEVRKRTLNRKRPKKLEKACPPSNAKHNLPAFTGINQLIIDNGSEEDTGSNTQNFCIEDEMDDLTDNKNKSYNIEKNSVCGAITNLIANYGSSDEDETLNVNDSIKFSNHSSTMKVPTAATVSCVSNKTETIAMSLANDINISTFKDCSVDKSDDSGPEEIKTVKTKEKTLLDSDSVPKQNSIPDKTNKITTKAAESGRVMKRLQNITKKLPSTLLEKLLFKEIRHERNVTLQCIRYIIKNNYFEK